MRGLKRIMENMMYAGMYALAAVIGIFLLVFTGER